jgi:hypothetical protein
MKKAATMPSSLVRIILFWRESALYI